MPEFWLEPKDNPEGEPELVRFENHYGAWVFSNTPTTGTFDNQSLGYIHEEADQGEDPDWIELEEEYDRDPDAFCQSYGWEPGMDWDHICDHMDWQQSTAYIGMVRDPKTGEWEADPNAEYSAIVSFGAMPITQVIRSQWLIRGGLCSPCCPGQVDPESEGDWLAYSVPPSVVGYEDQEAYGYLAEEAAKLKARIFPVPGSPAAIALAAGEVTSE